MSEQKKETPSQPMKSILDFLDAEQLAALELKYNTLDQEVRVSNDKRYSELKTVAERFIARSMVKVANSQLASKKRPGWYSIILMWAPSFQHLSADNPNKKLAVEKLKELSEQFDSKEATTLLKKFKNAQDVTSETPWIKEVCAVFGVDPKNLK